MEHSGLTYNRRTLRLGQLAMRQNNVGQIRHSHFNLQLKKLLWCHWLTLWKIMPGFVLFKWV